MSGKRETEQQLRLKILDGFCEPLVKVYGFVPKELEKWAGNSFTRVFTKVIIKKHKRLTNRNKEVRVGVSVRHQNSDQTLRFTTDICGYSDGFGYDKLTKVSLNDPDVSPESFSLCVIKDIEERLITLRDKWMSDLRDFAKCPREVFSVLKTGTLRKKQLSASL